MTDFLYGALLLFIVILFFNIIIFVHELGHYLAAKWRGLQIDRFQIWFGKPIWKKTINGVQYGLGWIPAGGFVALPQMVTMEAIEGENQTTGEQPLPAVKPIDKVIVAAAGPLFSLLLAFLVALVVWKVGKPQDAITNTVIGAVVEGSPAAEAGLQAGDRILAVDGEPVKWFRGDFKAVTERIMLTKNDQVTFEIERDGKVMEVVSNFGISETKWYQRKALPQVGIAPAGPVRIGAILETSTPGPAQRAGLEVGDVILSANGEQILSGLRLTQILKDNGTQAISLTVKRGEETLKKMLTPLIPEGTYYDRPMIGIQFDSSGLIEATRVYPNPVAQIGDSLKQMWITLSSVASPKSKVGLDQLAGPVGIAHMKFQLLLMEDGWSRLLFLLVLFNVNLAVLNLLPFPVLDGGHIVMALTEMVRGRPLDPRVLASVQSLFVLVLLGFFLFVTSKDLGALVPGQDGPGKAPEIVWPSE